MNNADIEYFKLIDLVLAKGKEKQNRTGIPTLGVFGAQARFDLAEGFPLLTTKKVWFKGVAHELLWFLSGSTNIKYLVDNDVHIWDDNAYDKYRKTCARHFEAQKPVEYPDDYEGARLAGFVPLSKEEYVQRIKADGQFAAKWGELGEGTYGGMWRAFPYFKTGWDEKTLDTRTWKPVGDSQMALGVGVVDQIQKVIDKLKSNPDDRRLVVSAWHPYWYEKCALSPCHILMNFNTEELTYGERLQWAGFSGLAHPDTLDAIGVPKRKLNLLFYCRSQDLPLGTPFNWASYALLTHLIAQSVNMVPGELIWTAGDCHIYLNQIEGIKEQMTREPKELPRLLLNPAVKDIFAFKYEDFKLVGYEPHPAIKIPFAV